MIMIIDCRGESRHSRISKRWQASSYGKFDEALRKWAHFASGKEGFASQMMVHISVHKLPSCCSAS